MQAVRPRCRSHLRCSMTPRGSACMAEPTLARRAPPLTPGTFLALLGPAERHVLRGDESVRAAAERAFGCPVPALACRAGVAGERAALWLGPDERRLLGPAAGAGPALHAALASLAHSLVAVSHRQCALEVSGEAAATLLAAGCPLDLDPAAFPVGMCTRTMLAKAEVTLWRTAPAVF